MPSESANNSNNRPARAPHSMGFPPPPQSEPLPCPRCDSVNTKFCYYNNYNLSQPRHFCKSCRRYWTHGGTLRDVPVGGGSRKNSKRSRYTTSSTSSASSSSSSCSSISHDALPLPPKSISILAGVNPDMPSNNNVNLNDNIAGAGAGTGTGSFTSLLSSQGSGFLALGGYGSAPGPTTGFDDMGFGLGRGLWSTYPEVGDLVGNYGGGGGAPETSSSGYNSWQINGTEGGGGVVDGDLLGWPDLAISMQGKSLK